MNVKVFLKKINDYISCLIKYPIAMAISPLFRSKNDYKDLWLISERGVDARDNGYYLFRYITKKHKDINIAYVISKNSSDRERVSKCGRIITHNSFKHFLALAVSKVKISTHIMGYTPCIDFFVRADKKGLVKGKKIFLQHGITKDNLPYLYCDNVNIDLFVCSAEPEYNYINSIYGYPDGVVRMLGMCRFDDLYKIDKPSKKILVMPTWRFHLSDVGEKEFSESEYCMAFNELLGNERLNDILEKYDYELLFYPHIQMQKFINCFHDGNRVKVVSFKDSTVQELLINSDILITDFSSVFFDYGYMEKPMIFYQFDEENFRKEHYSEGYFEYKNDAFGKVVYDEGALLDELEHILENNSVIDDEYLGKINNFFILRDKNNCERNFNAIKEIYEKS